MNNSSNSCLYLRIESLVEKKMAGKHLSMSLTNNKTAQLWQSFMPKRKEIKNAIGSDLYSMQVYDPSYFDNFDPSREFEKWAVVEVSSFENLPKEMEPFVLEAGLYAVFLHVGAASTGAQTFQTIFGSWLPNSGYMTDNRPHFEILGTKYKNEDPNSEEEIWIPIKVKE